jgi:hypothetical protein
MGKLPIPKRQTVSRDGKHTENRQNGGFPTGTLVAQPLSAGQGTEGRREQEEADLGGV